MQSSRFLYYGADTARVIITNPKLTIGVLISIGVALRIAQYLAGRVYGWMKPGSHSTS